MNLKTCLLASVTLLAFGSAKAQDTPVPVRANIISISPLQISDNGLGIGLSYERYLDKKKGLVSFYMPVAIAFKNSGGNYNPYNSYYFMPGIKIYPTGNQGIVKYSIGPNLTFLSDRIDTYQNFYDINGRLTNVEYGTTDRFVMGMMINNTLNINPSDHLHMALEFGLGFSYLSSYSNDETKAFVQFGYQIGYRF